MKNNNAITLISLVITIAVMLILASVSINVSINTGLIDRTTNTKDNWNNSEVLDEICQKITKMAIESSDGSVKYTEISNFIGSKYEKIVKIVKIDKDGIELNDADADEKAVDAKLKFINGEVTINNEQKSEIKLSEIDNWIIDYTKDE